MSLRPRKIRQLRQIAEVWVDYEENPDGAYGMEDAMLEYPEMLSWSEEDVAKFLTIHAEEYEKRFRKALAAARAEEE